ncbi:trans-aconitate 2-methyltransferase [uncultured Kiloniella sp.]|uniref:trans-aconitate 2-methyltransferase n=1 Tax=uncultured Kiloniella sp. TaxID=1133091 RepID=UPI00262ADE6C|nr:trans-aconitate 2-methyltransferase [uncultured Kiloniella sp.]
MKNDWNTDQYLQFEDLRTRPAYELLNRVSIDKPETVVDLGCGPGNSTELLKRKFPSAAILGVDSSPKMLEEAKKRLPDAEFALDNIAMWHPQEKADVIFANASLQWVTGHSDLFPRLMQCLKPGGILAVQMPDNLSEPTHALMREVASEGPWTEMLSEAVKSRETIGSCADYYNWVTDQSDVIDIWRTSYEHVLVDAEGIVDWFKSTGLRPFLGPLNDQERTAYLEQYLGKIKQVYKPLKDGRVLLTFPRLFVVAQKKI